MYPTILYFWPFFIGPAEPVPPEKPVALAGWYNLLPAFPNYDGPRYDAPFIQRIRGHETTYSQTLHFKGIGKARRSFSITFARDAELPNRFSSAAMKALGDPPESIRIDDRLVWVWSDQRKIVVLIDKDKAVILENNLPQIRMPLVDCARKLDYKHIGELLSKPPRMDFTVSIDTFRTFRKGDPLHAVTEWCGPADRVAALTSEVDGAKDRKVLRFDLKGDATVFVIGRSTIETIRHEAKDGKIEHLVK